MFSKYFVRLWDMQLHANMTRNIIDIVVPIAYIHRERKRERNLMVKLARDSSFTLHSIMHRWKVCYFTLPNTKMLGCMNVS